MEAILYTNNLVRQYGVSVVAYTQTPKEFHQRAPPRLPLQIMRNKNLPPLVPHVSYLESRKHLPIIELKRAA